jgi:membrane associated rhomboid family serine protease
MAGFGGLTLGAPRGAAKATVGLIVALAATFVLAWFGLRQAFGPGLAFDPAELAARPWTLLTYPFASAGDGGGLFFTLIMWLVLYMFGGAVERDAGPVRLLGLFLGGSVIAGLFIALGARIAGPAPVLMGPALGVACVIVAWAARNAEATILLFFILPLKGKYLAILTFALTFFAYGTGAPLIGLFAVVALALAWLWASGRLGVAFAGGGGQSKRSRAERRAEERRHREFITSVKDREREREEKERLRRLFERSLIEDPDEKKP